MIRKLKIDEVSKQVDLVPQAIISRPMSYFVEGYGASDKVKDDLAIVDVAAFALDGLLFALKHYPGEPKDTVTVYLSSTISQKVIPGLLSQITDAFKLPSTSVTWQRKDNPEY